MRPLRRFSNRQAPGTLSELNITPMLDLAFTLLIIFVITTPLLEQSILLTPPSTAPLPVEGLDPHTVRIVSIDRAGSLYFQEHRVSISELAVILDQSRRATQDLAVGLRADRSLPYDRVVQVLEVIQRAGIQRFGLITGVEETGPSR